MIKVQLSSTYRFLFDNIIGELLSQICVRFPCYCVRNKQVPYLLIEKIEEYRQAANKNMSNPRLDRHKLASCICGAIIEVQPIAALKAGVDAQRANEFFALHAGLNVIKYYMMYDLTHDQGFSVDAEARVKNFLRENFNMRLPSISENICDTQEYELNMRNALHWTHHKCVYTNRECYHYDVWAYAKLFYHLELYNKPMINDAYQKLVENNDSHKEEQDS
ncbi:MAG: hypothetical protein NC121_05230 [Blautia sp.]|nr:hypothetical protein [Blautia sp.]